MEMDLLHTFVELEDSGTMSLTARRLYITQATVSARIAQLEEIVGARLFFRSKRGTRLTPQGKLLSPTARAILQSWREAKTKLGSITPNRPRLRVGGEITLSTSLLPNWLVSLRQRRTDLELRAVVDTAERLLDSLERGELDLAVLYSPLRRPRIKTKLVLREELICVSTQRHCTQLAVDDYVYVDWGPDFAAQHDRALADLGRGATTIELGPLALRYLLRVGGFGYFRTRAVAPYLRAKRLHRVPRMPKFSYSIHAASSPSAPDELVEWALSQLSASTKVKVEAWA